MNETQVQNKIQGQYMITYDIAVIRMCDIFDSMKSLCLMKKFDGIFRMHFNTGTVASVLQSGGYLVTSGTTSTFYSTEFFLHSLHPPLSHLPSVTSPPSLYLPT